MCFGSTNNTKRSIAVASAAPVQATRVIDFNAIVSKLDAEYVNAAQNKKGRRTVDAFDILGSLVRAKRDNNTARVLSLLDEYAADFR